MSEVLHDVAMLVRVDNPHDIASAVKGITETVKAPSPHAVANTWGPLPAIGAAINAQQNVPVEIVPLDPLRERAIISFNGSGQVILCHSQAQAQSLQQNVQQAADEGALFTCPTGFAYESTAPLWAVAVPGVTSQNSIGASGKVTAPGALATIASRLLTPGTYQVTVTAYLDGTIVVATDEDNIEFTSTGSPSIPLLLPGVADVPITSGPFYVTSDGTITVSVKSIVAGSAAAVYHAQIVATPFPFATGSSGLTVGVLAERRDS